MGLPILHRSLLLVGGFLCLMGCSELASPSSTCSSNVSCPDNLVCVNGDCIVECYLDSDCDAGTCNFNRCRGPVGQPGDAVVLPADAASDGGDAGDSGDAGAG